jgi:hypothetical protein
MSQAPHSLRRLAAGAIIVAASCSAQTNSFAQLGKFVTQEDEQIFFLRTPMPLGAEGYHLAPANKNFYLLACVEDPQFDGLRVSRIRSDQSVVDPSGRHWKNFPAEVNFRVTATALADVLNNLDSEVVNEPGDLNGLFLGLKFRLKVYRGLEVRILPPSSLKLIGVPADVPSEERVYRVSFDTKDLPVDDRLVLEVLTPGGQLLSRFHLELL